MTKRLLSTAKKRRPYRPRGYRSVFATDVDPETEEETSSEVSEEEVGLSADEFTGDLTDDPLADLADESIWAVTPGTDEDYSVTGDDFEREEAITNTSSRHVAEENKPPERPRSQKSSSRDNKVRAHQRTPERKKDPMTAVDRYLRYASWRGMDPQSKSTLRAFARSGRGTSKTAQRDISRWFMAQEVAHDTARQVLATTRGYRRKMSSSWHLDNKLSAYISKVQQKFACSCGAKLDVPAYNICKCGKIWNAYKVHSATKGDTMYVVREVPVRENVLVANKTGSRRQADFLHQKVFDAFEDYLMDRGVHPHKEAPQGEIDQAIDDFVAEYGNQLSPYGIESLQSAYMYREGSRRQAYDVEDDTYDFFEKARGRGYRFPKNMGDDPDSGTFQDELHNYTGGDRDRMRQVTDFARDNWGQYRNLSSYRNRRHASDRAFEDPDTGFSVAVDNRGGSEVGVVLDPDGSEVDTIHPFNGEYFEDDMYELVNGLDDWLQDADTDSYRREFHSKKRESRNRRRRANGTWASPKEFGETYLQNNGWSSIDTGRTTWDSPSGNVSYFGHDNLINVWNRDGDLVDEIPVDPYMDPNDLVSTLNELEQSAAKDSPWYVNDQKLEHPGPDADYLHPYFN